MASQMTITDELRARDEEIAKASAHYHTDVMWAQEAAIRVASRLRSSITIDDVRDQMRQEGYDRAFGNWLGAIFKDADTWERVGFSRSRHPGSHARIVSRWRLKGRAA